MRFHASPCGPLYMRAIPAAEGDQTREVRSHDEGGNRAWTVAAGTGGNNDEQERKSKQDAFFAVSNAVMQPSFPVLVS